MKMQNTAEIKKDTKENSKDEEVSKDEESSGDEESSEDEETSEDEGTCDEEEISEDETEFKNGVPGEVTELIEEFDSVDGDSCSLEEINNIFENRYVEVHSINLAAEDTSCSKLIADNRGTYIASVLSDKSVVIVDRETFKIHSSFKPHKKEVTDIKLSPQNPNLIYTSSLDGKIKVWDLRSKSFEKTINANTTETKKPLTSFDVSPQERLVCAGTELIGEDSFLLFWDIRGDKLLGGYWESHSDDITCVKFNPNRSETLGSAGADCLLNIFDVSRPSEDEALTYCLNTEKVVNTFSWRNENKKTNILAFTDNLSVQMWDVEEASATHTFSREAITKALRRNVTYECYPIPMTYSSMGKNPLVLAGSGLEHSEVSCLRTLRINERSGQLEPHGMLITETEKIPSITQVASCAGDSEDLVTVREDGRLSLWRRKTSKSESLKTQKVKHKNKSKIKPY